MSPTCSVAAAATAALLLPEPVGPVARVDRRRRRLGLVAPHAERLDGARRAAAGWRHLTPEVRLLALVRGLRHPEHRSVPLRLHLRRLLILLCDLVPHVGVVIHLDEDVYCS